MTCLLDSNNFRFTLELLHCLRLLQMMDNKPRMNKRRWPVDRTQIFPWKFDIMKYLILMKTNRSISTPKHLVYDTQACYHIYNEIDMNFLFIWMEIQYSGLLKTILLQCSSWYFFMCSPQHWSFATYDLLFVSCFWNLTGSLNFNDALIQHIQREFPHGVSFHLLLSHEGSSFSFFLTPTESLSCPKYFVQCIQINFLAHKFPY